MIGQHSTRLIGQFDTFLFVRIWIEPGSIAGYEAFGRVLELLDQG
jgi:hypothetical protein